MTGSDWRSYELDFNYYANFLDYVRNAKGIFEIGFWLVFLTLKTVFRDFFIVIGLLKILYLYSLIKFLKTITDNWIASIAILLPISLAFMMIDNPLRFMTAMIFVNWALYFFVQGKRKKGIVFLCLSVLFHNTCILLLPIFLLFSQFTKVLKYNNVVLWVTYIVVFLLFSDGGPLGVLLQRFQTQMVEIGAKDYSSYMHLNEGAFFSLGSILQILLFSLLLLVRNKLLSLQFGDMIFSCSVLFFFMGRVLILVPTGFRLAIPLGYFAAVSWSSIICRFRGSYYGKILLIYFLLLFSSKLWRSYTYLPYSNSIPYILTSHKPYSERSEYNLSKYMQRRGRDYYNQ